MNVVFVNSTRSWGGVKTWTLDLAVHFLERGDAVHVFSRPGPFHDSCSSKGIPATAFEFGIDFNPGLILRFIRYFKKNKTDIVVCNVGKDMRTAGIAAKLLGIPVVHRIGLPGDARNVPKVRWLHKWIRPSILVPSHDTAQGLLKELPYLRPEEVTVVHTGKVPAEDVPDSVHKPLTFITTSQLNKDKGHADLLRALARLRDEGHDFRLIALATGREEATLHALTEKLNLSDRVEWVGFQSDVQSFLRKADVFVLASKSEGLPNALLEAMAQGLIPIARSVGGVKEIWPEALADLLVTGRAGHDNLLPPLERVLSASETECLSWKRIARETCDERFNLEKQAETIAKWLQRIIHPSTK